MHAFSDKFIDSLNTQVLSVGSARKLSKILKQQLIIK